MNRNRVTLTGLMAVLLVSTAHAGATAGATVASAYVFRGATLNDSPVLQPSLETSRAGFTLGAWGNLDLAGYDDLDLESGQFSEIDLYGSYALPLPGKLLGVSAGYTEYTYPSSDSDADRELGLSLKVDAFLAPSLAAAVTAIWALMTITAWAKRRNTSRSRGSTRANSAVA